MMMRTLLLGAAAGLVTVGAAQAADLPMTKAEAVEYVKVCTEFGEGFFYIPGTDTCLKIGGELRANYRFFDRDSRQTDVTAFSTEARLKFDARTATEYGTLRSYIQLNLPVFGATGGGSDGSNFYLDKAFIQFGGLTAGYAHTFFGIYDADYGSTIFAPYYSSASTVNLLAYTAVFGGGFSATLSVEDGTQHRSSQGLGLVTLDTAAAVPFTLDNVSYGGQSMPDFVANLRLDGAWGEAAIFGAVHQTRYPDAVTVGGAPPIGLDYDVPGADYGWAVGAGLGYNLPFLAGSHIALEATYADGANNYLGYNGSPDSYFGIYTGDTDAGKGWSLTGEFGVNISPALNVTAFGSYLHYEPGDLTVLDPVAGVTGTVDGEDVSNWVAGINATYTVVPGLVIQPEVYYTHTESIFADDVDDDNENQWAGGVRIKRTF
jgi:hypothetical protein